MGLVHVLEAEKAEDTMVTLLDILSLQDIQPSTEEYRDNHRRYGAFSTQVLTHTWYYLVNPT